MARLDKTGLQYLLDKIHTFLNRFSLKSETVFSVNEETPVDGNVTLNEVPYAGNLISENAQVSRADVLIRTSGGDASIADGDAWLVRLLGNREYSVPPVAEVLEMTVDPIEREEPITAVIDRDTFVGYVESSTILDFYYTTEWSANLALYGITVTGEPVSGDHISVNYVKEDRGVIVQSTPSAFVSTGWNLYNASTGRARAVKYSEQYGFKIGGAFTSVSFVEEIGDTPIPITVVSGNFTVPSDGWIIVSGGDSTTYVYMTWSDWTEEPAGSFEMYTQSVIDLSTVMVNFPNGLMRAGNVRDEINLNTLVATSNVERLAYNASNLEMAEQSGREYEVDRDYIYIAKSTPNTYSISVSGAYIASDHGIEFVDGTTIPVFIETLYGNNLKNKLERDVLTISAQELTSAQKTRVLENIGGAKDDAFSEIFVNKGLMSDNVDFNNLITSGTYRSNGTNAGAINPPSTADNGYLIVVKTNINEGISQIWLSAFVGKHMVRHLTNGVWSQWEEVNPSTSYYTIPNIGVIRIVGNIAIIDFKNQSGQIPSTGFQLPYTFLDDLSTICQYYNGSTNVVGELKIYKNGKVYVRSSGSYVNATYVTAQITEYLG